MASPPDYLEIRLAASSFSWNGCVGKPYEFFTLFLMAFEASLCHPEKPKNAKIAQWSENFSLGKFKPSAKQQQTEQFFNFCGKNLNFKNSIF